jgi:hypothetical protein
LPAFSATLNVPQQTPFSDEKLPIQITAEYSFGDPVEGTGTLEISRWGETVLTRTIEIKNGESSFELDVTNDLNIDNPEAWNSYDYTLVVTDSILNSKANVEGYFQVVANKYNIEMIGNQVITPGSSYSYSVKVYSQDGSFPPQGTKVSVTIYPQNIVQELTLNSAGSASSTVSVPSDTYYLNFYATAPQSNPGSLYAFAQQGSSGTISLYPNLRQGER